MEVVHVLGIVAYRGVEVQLHALIMSEIGDEWLASRRGCFICGKTVSGIS